MERGWRSLQGYAVHGTDGHLGSLEDCYFDDRDWSVRWMVVDIGSWWRPQLKLLSPVDLGEPDGVARSLTVPVAASDASALTPAEADRPVGRQMGAFLQERYGWMSSWAILELASFPCLGRGDIARLRQDSASGPTRGSGDPYLRGTREVMGYEVRERDGIVGRVVDLVLQDDGWRITGLMVRDGRWLRSREARIDPMAIRQIWWSTSEVHVELSQVSALNLPAAGRS